MGRNGKFPGDLVFSGNPDGSRDLITSSCRRIEGIYSSLLQFRARLSLFPHEENLTALKVLFLAIGFSFTVLRDLFVLRDWDSFDSSLRMSDKLSRKDCAVLHCFSIQGRRRGCTTFSSWRFRTKATFQPSPSTKYHFDNPKRCRNFEGSIFLTVTVPTSSIPSKIC